MTEPVHRLLVQVPSATVLHDSKSMHRKEQSQQRDCATSYLQLYLVVSTPATTVSLRACTQSFKALMRA